MHLAFMNYQLFTLLECYTMYFDLNLVRIYHAMLTDTVVSTTVLYAAKRKTK